MFWGMSRLYSQMSWPVAASQGFDNGSRRLQVHDAIVHQRDALLRAGALRDRPGELELADVGLVDLL